MCKNKQATNLSKANLKNIEISIDEFGNIVTSVKQEQINEFLDKNVKDRKLEHLNSDL